MPVLGLARSVAAVGMISGFMLSTAKTPSSGVGATVFVCVSAFGVVIVPSLPSVCVDASIWKRVNPPVVGNIAGTQNMDQQLRRKLQCYAMLCNAMQCCAMLCNAVQSCAMLCNAVQC